MCVEKIDPYEKFSQKEINEMSTSELIDYFIPKEYWSRGQLFDYIYFLEEQLNEYKEF